MLDQNAVAVVDFVLDDLGGEAGECFDARLHGEILRDGQIGFGSRR